MTNGNGNWTHGIYAIYDLQAEEIVGGLHIHRNNAAAIRMFNDVAMADQTMVNRHTIDYNLIKIADLDISTAALHAITPETVLTGEAWANVNRPQAEA